MQKIDEHKIEQYLRFPEELSTEEIREVEELIAANPEAKAVAEWMRDFYAEYDLLNRPLIMQLSPQKFTANHSGPMVLAAMTTPESVTGLQTKVTFASRENQTLLRVLEDAENHKLQFHVISRFLGPEDRALIHLKEPGIELITEKGGRLVNVVNPSLSGLNWENILAELRMPASTCSYNYPEEEKAISLCEDCSMLVEKNTCTLYAFRSDISRVLVEQASQSSLYYVEGDRVSFPIDQKRSFNVHLYA